MILKRKKYKSEYLHDRKHIESLKQKIQGGRRFSLTDAVDLQNILRSYQKLGYNVLNEKSGWLISKERNNLWYLRMHGNNKVDKLMRYLYNEVSEMYLKRKRRIWQEGSV